MLGQFAQDYRDLGIDYVFLLRLQEDQSQRLLKIKLGGAEPKYIKHRGDKFSATNMLELARLWGFTKY